MGFSIMCLFKDLQEVEYPGVNPHAEVSWDLEFMGTRSCFPTLVSFCMSSHPAATLILPHFSIFNPTAATAIFLIAALVFFHHPPSLFLNIPALPLTHLMTCLLLFLALSPFHDLAYILLNQLNCYPPLHLHVSSFISHSHHTSVMFPPPESAISHLLYIWEQ